MPHRKLYSWTPEIGGVAQLGERLLCKQEVRGSNPLVSTERFKKVPKKGKSTLDKRIKTWYTIKAFASAILKSECACGGVGDYSEGGTPVPIPNTVVKPFSPHDTAGEALWDNRTPPIPPPVQSDFLYPSSSKPKR
jgi:hypothetical protein